MCSLGMSHGPIEQDYLGIAKIKGIVDRCRLGNPFSQWCIAYAATSQWNHVPPPLLSLLSDTFRGWTQSRVNEKANKVWRDAGRDNANRFASSCTLWEKLTNLGALAEFGREEIVVGQGNRETREKMKEEMADLFEDAKDKKTCGDQASEEEMKQVEEDNKFLASFNDILKDAAKSQNPESEQALVAELRFLRLLHEHDLWKHANDSWQTALLPVNALIRTKSMAQCLWVLKVHDTAALCWPAEEVETGVWRKSVKVQELVWYTCFDLKEVQVLTVKVCSPMHLRIKDSNFFDRFLFPNGFPSNLSYDKEIYNISHFIRSY